MDRDFLKPRLTIKLIGKQRFALGIVLGFTMFDPTNLICCFSHRSKFFKESFRSITCPITIERRFIDLTRERI